MWTRPQSLDIENTVVCEARSILLLLVSSKGQAAELNEQEVYGELVFLISAYRGADKKHSGQQTSGDLPRWP